MTTDMSEGLDDFEATWRTATTIPDDDCIREFPYQTVNDRVTVEKRGREMENSMNPRSSKYYATEIGSSGSQASGSNESRTEPGVDVRSFIGGGPNNKSTPQERVSFVEWHASSGSYLLVSMCMDNRITKSVALLMHDISRD